MYRTLPVQRGLHSRPTARIQHAVRTRRQVVLSRGLHGKNGAKSGRRSGNLKSYASSAIALGLIALSAAWAFYPSQATEPQILHERNFQPFTIVSKEPVSSTSSIYTLQPGFRTTSDPYTKLWEQGVWSVEFKQPQLQIARSYTPLPPNEDSAPGDLRFLVRREHKGEVSNYLDRLRVGAIIDVRGPKVEYEILENVSEVLFLAGGTGIAPALQVVHTLLKKRSENVTKGKPVIHILWASRKGEDCLGARKTVVKSWWRTADPALPEEEPNKIVKELQDLEKAFEGQVKIDCLVDEENTFIDKGRISKITNKSSISSQGAPALSGKKLLILSGPDGFVNYFAGPKEWEEGQLVQGRLGGVLAQMKLNDWTVVKL
jgi:cytochrome-b5 reductase